MRIIEDSVAHVVLLSQNRPDVRGGEGEEIEIRIPMKECRGKTTRNYYLIVTVIKIFLSKKNIYVLYPSKNP